MEEVIYGLYNKHPFKLTLSEHSDKSTRNEIMSKFIDDSIEWCEQEIYDKQRGLTLEVNNYNAEFEVTVTIEVVESLEAMDGIHKILYL